jgi:hypothetical protein
VFDDNSKNQEQIRNIVGILPRLIYYQRDKKTGVKLNTPLAIEEMFDSGSENILIIDSDSLLHPMWWIVINNLYSMVDEFDLLSIFNDSTMTPGELVFDGKAVKKGGIGAFGMMIPKRTWNKYKGRIDGGITGWDNRLCEEIFKDNGRIYVSNPSYVQHLGYTDGAHSGHGTGSYAEDFPSRVEFDYSFCEGNMSARRDILFAMYGRHGDIIQGSMIANMLKDMGYIIDVVTIPYYLDLTRVVCPGLTIKRETHMPDVEGVWWHTTTHKLKEFYPDQYKYYINAQFGAIENHDDYMRSGLQPLEWLSRRCESILSRPLDRNWLKYLRHGKVKEAQVHFRNKEKQLAIIAPDAITSQALTGEMVNKIKSDLYDDGFDVRILEKGRPNRSFRIARHTSVWVKTFEQLIDLFEQCDLFVGNDSGPAWAALYSDCEKKIYHKKDRIVRTNTYFSNIDKKAEDIIVD